MASTAHARSCRPALGDLTNDGSIAARDAKNHCKAGTVREIAARFRGASVITTEQRLREQERHERLEYRRRQRNIKAIHAREVQKDATESSFDEFALFDEMLCMIEQNSDSDSDSDSDGGRHIDAKDSTNRQNRCIATHASADGAKSKARPGVLFNVRVEAEAENEVEIEAEAVADIEVEAEAEAKAKAKAKAKAEATANTVAAVGLGAQTRAEMNVGVAAEAKADPAVKVRDTWSLVSALTHVGDVVVAALTSDTESCRRRSDEDHDREGTGLSSSPHRNASDAGPDVAFWSAGANFAGQRGIGHSGSAGTLARGCITQNRSRSQAMVQECVSMSSATVPRVPQSYPRHGGKRVLLIAAGSSHALLLCGRRGQDTPAQAATGKTAWGWWMGAGKYNTRTDRDWDWNTDVYAFGSNACGQLGLLDSAGAVDGAIQAVPRRVTALSGRGVRRLACGSLHSLALASGVGGAEDGQGYAPESPCTGVVLAFGSNIYGQLGLGYKSQREGTPKQVPALADQRGDANAHTLGVRAVVDVACGALHSAAVVLTSMTTSGGARTSAHAHDGADCVQRVATWGRAEDGRLGLGRGCCDDRCTPALVPLFESLKVQPKAANAGAGAWDRVRMLALPGLGVMRLGRRPERVKPSAVAQSRRAVALRAVACGGGHTLLLANDGRLFACGRNNSGQLGFTSRGSEFYARGVSLPEDVQGCAVACGSNHSLVLDRKGVVYAFGDNHHGQLGLNRSVDNCDYPAVVAMTAGGASHGKVTGIVCGGNNSFAVMAVGANSQQSAKEAQIGARQLESARAEIVGWGANELHQLPTGGHGSDTGNTTGTCSSSCSAPTPLRMPDGAPLAVAIKAEADESSAMLLGAGVDFAVFAV